MSIKIYNVNGKIENPIYYGGKDNVYEAIKIIESLELNFCLGNVIKYIVRAGKKDESTKIEDLEKAAWYLNHEIIKIRNKEQQCN